MLTSSESIIIQGVTRVIVPFMQVFGLYVVFHGHYSPGGGFQGGALLAASILLERIVLGKRHAWHLFSVKLGLPLGILGLLIFAGIGLMGLQPSHMFLDYSALPFAISAAELRALGILIVELGIGLAVLGTLVLIFDQIISRGRI